MSANLIYTDITNAHHVCRLSVTSTCVLSVVVIVTEACLVMSIQEYEARQVAARGSPTHHTTGQQSRKKVEFEPSSTTALILEDRPPYVYFLSLRLFV